MPLRDGERLHLGCGLTAPPGWVNVDGSWQAELARFPRVRRALSTMRLVPARQTEIPWPTGVRRLDLRRPLPFVSSSFAVVYSSHLLEHLHRAEAVRLMRECRRVLRPGGVCRAVVPDLGRLVDDYVQSRREGKADPGRELVRSLQLRPEELRGQGIYRIYQALTDFHSHKWMYDEEALIALFEECGFTSAERRPMWDSRIEGIRDVELETRAAEGAGICVEAVKGEG